MKAFANVVEHEDGAHQESRGISDPLAGNVRRGAVDGFENGAFIANVAAGNNAQTANETGGKVAHHIAIEIGEQENVELLRVDNNLHTGVVDNQFLVLDIGILFGDGAHGFKEQAIAELHDIGFVDGVNLLAAELCERIRRRIWRCAWRLFR